MSSTFRRELLTVGVQILGAEVALGGACWMTLRYRTARRSYSELSCAWLLPNVMLRHRDTLSSQSRSLYALPHDHSSHRVSQRSCSVSTHKATKALRTSAGIQCTLTCSPAALHPHTLLCSRNLLVSVSGYPPTYARQVRDASEGRHGVVSRTRNALYILESLLHAEP